MAKKQKRQVPQSAAPVSSSASPSFRRTITTSPAEFAPDYTYIKNDLKRIGALAGSFFVILIVLSFIIK